MASDAEIAVDAFHVRQDAWPSSKFKPPKRTRRETDPKLPGVVFYRFPDNSLARLEGGDLVVS